MVKEDEVEEFMNSLDLEDIHGVGSKTVDRLSSLGITSVEDLSNADIRPLVEEFGENLGPKLFRKAQGIDNSEVKERRQKQYSRITTLKGNSSDFEYISDYLEDLAVELEEKLTSKELYAGKVVLITIDTNLKMRTRSANFEAPAREKETIPSKGKEILRDFLAEFEGEIRRVGLRVMDFKKMEKQKRLSDF